MFYVTGHGGSDGLHGYVPSLDHVVADTVCIFLLSSVCMKLRIWTVLWHMFLFLIVALRMEKCFCHQ